MDKKIQQYGNAYNENGFGPVNNVQQQVNQLKQEIQQKTEQLDDLEKQLATNNSNGQMSRNMGNLRRQMGGNDYGMARTSYKNGLDANQYDRRYGTR
jgi:chromosome segregation ATPase